MIEVDGLTKRFGSIVAVDNVSFNVRKGEIFGYLGPNGAGKTTTIRMLCGLISPTKGVVRIEGVDVAKNNDVRKLIGFLPETPGLYERLTLMENLEFYAKLYKIERKIFEERAKKYLGLLDLWERRNDIVGTLSKGMKQKASLVRALLHEPKYLFLDEPTSNLDPRSAKVVRRFITRLRKEHKAIFISTHNLFEAQKLCNRIVVLNKKILLIGKPGELRKSLFSPRTIIELDEVTNKIRYMLERKHYSFKVKGSTLSIQASEKDNPGIVSMLVNAGAKIRFVREQEHSLEDVYFKLVKERK